jgi:PKD repeat protein
MRWPWILVAGMCLLFCTGACIPCVAQIQAPVAVRTSLASVPAANPPVADFSADITRGTAPLTVRFTDASVNTPAAWLWDFNADGQAESKSRNPVYTYSDPGVYSVTLTVSGTSGRDTVTKYQYITVTKEPGAPVAGFSARPRQGPAPLVVRFTDTSRNNPSSWLWDFNADGVIDSREKEPGFTFTEPGSYTVILLVASDTGKDEEIQADYIIVSPGVEPPVAEFTTYPGEGTAPLTVLFTDASRNSPTAWEWDFGNDGGIDSREQNPEWTFPEPGIFAVRLIVRNSAGSNEMVMKSAVTVQPPVPNAPRVSSPPGSATRQVSVTTVTPITSTPTQPSLTVSATASAAPPVTPEATAPPPAPDPGPLPDYRLSLLLLAVALLAGGFLVMRSRASRASGGEHPDLHVEMTGGIEYRPGIHRGTPDHSAPETREQDRTGQEQEEVR